MELNIENVEDIAKDVANEFVNKIKALSPFLETLIVKFEVDDNDGNVEKEDDNLKETKCEVKSNDAKVENEPLTENPQSCKFKEKQKEPLDCECKCTNPYLASNKSCSCQLEKDDYQDFDQWKDEMATCLQSIKISMTYYRRRCEEIQKIYSDLEAKCKNLADENKRLKKENLELRNILNKLKELCDE